MSNNEVNLKTFATHDGTFHADEVTACALLLQFGLIDRDKVYRSREASKLEDCDFVCDVGGIYDASTHRFDHHQSNYQGMLSSAGMILLFLREQKIVEEGLCDYLNNYLVIGVDAHDNGRELHSSGVCTYSHIITLFNPLEHDSPAFMEDEAFAKALDFARTVVGRLCARYYYIKGCRDAVAQAMEGDKECLFFERNIPWLESFFALGGEKHPAKFVIMPSGHHWKLRGIPPSLQRKMEVRHPLPLAWAGLLEDQLQEETGIPGAIFCHKGRFISVWETRAAAEQALAIILKDRH